MEIRKESLIEKNTRLIILDHNFYDFNFLLFLRFSFFPNVLYYKVEYIKKIVLFFINIKMHLYGLISTNFNLNIIKKYTIIYQF